MSSPRPPPSASSGLPSESSPACWPGGPPSLRFLAYLVRRMETLPVLVAVGVRTAEPGVDERLLGEIACDPLAVAVRPAPLSEPATDSSHTCGVGPMVLLERTSDIVTPSTAQCSCRWRLPEADMVPSAPPPVMPGVSNAWVVS